MPAALWVGGSCRRSPRDQVGAQNAAGLQQAAWGAVRMDCVPTVQLHLGFNKDQRSVYKRLAAMPASSQCLKEELTAGGPQTPGPVTSAAAAVTAACLPPTPPSLPPLPHQMPPPRCRAYKLGRNRWSYNQIELLLGDGLTGGRAAVVTQAANASPPATGTSGTHQGQQEPGAVCFNIQLESGHSLQAHLHLCYDEPVEAPRQQQQQQQEDEPQQEGSSSSSGRNGGGAAEGSSELHSW